MAEPRTGSAAGRRALRRGLPVALGGLLIGTTTLIWTATGNAQPRYRTASAAIADVAAGITATGTVAEAESVEATFATAGTVTEVAVAEGERVEQGDVLARLDPADLDAAVTAAEATLAKARATLESDRAAADDTAEVDEAAVTPQPTTSATPTPKPRTPTPSPAPTGSAGPGGAGAGSPAIDLTKQIAAVNAARAKVTTTAAAVTAAAANQAQDCAQVVGQPAGEPEAGEPDANEPDAAQIASCLTAMQATIDAQRGLTDAYEVLGGAEAALAAAMNAAVAQLTAQAQAASAEAAAITAAANKEAQRILTEAQAAAARTTAKPTGTQSGGTTGAGSALDAAARVTVDEAAVRAAELSLEGAQQARKTATLRAPMDGIVGTVDFAEGKTASSTDAVTILGDGAMAVTLAVPLSTATQLTSGMAAEVVSDGAKTPSAGSVTAVGVLPATSGSPATYPVTVLVPEPDAGLAQGATATVRITLRTAQDVVAVPNSAIAATGTTGAGYVTLLQDGKPVRQSVTTGTTGASLTEIVSGLTAGQIVVLADPDKDVPASSSTSSGSSAGTGGFGARPTGAGTAPTAPRR